MIPLDRARNSDQFTFLKFENPSNGSKVMGRVGWSGRVGLGGQVGSGWVGSGQVRLGQVVGLVFISLSFKFHKNPTCLS